ncbi:phospholipase C, phosphocholine-specific [Sphingomonas sp. PP-CE-1G-424]|uniref:phosphocholine-specific phospholipase C n=1 Tax=Sphingomonas sp. PP-CE-1G-424 TaxID=2135658 RepID=UPI001056029B|nr:phospholipase C, phosphocholine-specific [Sphingomonas sp. PP-CE-1G-424]TCP67016.1 phospholipase C [Sphingomonas sp. PP-CE-1G-424]
MIDHPTRRTLIGAGLAAATTGVLPGTVSSAIGRALAIPADVRTGTIADVDHVVILMQENRGFDHYFGTLRGVRGFADPLPIPLPISGPGNRDIWSQETADGRHVAPFHLSTEQHFALMRMAGTPHTWPDAQAAWDHGRMARWPAAKTERSLGHYARADLPFQFALAEAFTICDAYHAAIQTGTNTNRIMLWTGTNDPAGTHGGPAIGNSHDSLPADGGWPEGYRWTTYPERLQAAGIDWRIYEDMADNFTDNPLAGFAAYRGAAPGSALHDRAMTTHGLDRLRADVVGGTLPQVSWIIANAAGSEHPGPSSPAQGAAYTAAVLDALTADPKIWARTALFVMFDENDGFFDHVPPPAPPSPDASAPGGFAGASSIAAAADYHHVASPGEAKADTPECRGRPYGLGPRVPCYVVSPWSRGGWVNSQVFDHTSVIRFLETRFGVAEPNISAWRRAVCGDLTSAFDFTRANGAAPAPLPDPRASAARAAALKGQPDPRAPAAGARAPQEPGIRPSRALPYDLNVTVTQIGAAGITLDLACRGAPAVVHVYDRHRLDRIPRRYTLAAGDRIAATWPLDDEGRYDLWLLGPNGFHRHFAGQKTAKAVSWRLDPARETLSVTVPPGLKAVSLRHTDAHRGWRGDGRPHPLSLAETGGWYDILVTDPAHPAFRRRIAGRLETGRASWSEPPLARA